jgi:hypothetical protein
VGRPVRPSIDASIKYRQHFVEQMIGGLSNELGLARKEIDGLDLFDHDESLYLWDIGDRYMERVTLLETNRFS